MRSPEARADDIAARLSAAGFAPRLQHHDDRIAIEMEVSGSASEEAWRELFPLLETADRFGLISSGSDRIAWAAVHRNTPATTDVVRGHGHQL
ncbi:hypothetical protein ACTPOK_20115 [Streptomyces inhibens]|uniref:hypothetical protein n=1 Tax=Streptomyces inhibens TaxID=2293571 RepID=UPI00402ADADA